MKNYEELYKEALERAKEHYHAGCFAPAMLERIFPELKESEDERTRKELLGFIENWKNPNNVGRLDDYPMFTKNEEQCNKYIAWLEKQGEKSQDKPANNAEKVEPKFHKGDWVIDNNCGKVKQVREIEKNGYGFNNGDYSSFESAAKNYHTWTIQEAKDGDVLVDKYSKDSIIILYRCINTNLSVVAYCGWNGYDFSVRTKGLGYGCLDNTKYVPATKEQRDLLFAKMKEAGYEWDAEKKELRKVMTIEENMKELLLKDLCARLPYGVVLHHIPSGENTTLEFIGQGVIDGDIHDVIENFKPYLRPMSSMTEEEKEEYTSYVFEQPFLQKDKIPNMGSVPMCIDWLNLHHFDYRGLIEKGLALEAPEGMY